MKYIMKYDEFIAEALSAMNEKEELYNGMTIDQLMNKYKNFKGSNKQLLANVLRVLSGVDYTEDYIELLSTILEDRRVRHIMKMGFGGDWGKNHIKVELKKVVTENLHPTQNEIDLAQSLEFSLKNFKGSIDHIHDKNGGMLKNTPIVTFNDKYIIDGHHRWSQIYCFNRVFDGKPSVCQAINFSNDDISPVDMLKIVQTTIATDLYPEPIPSSKADKNPERNLLSPKCTEEIIRDFITGKNSEGQPRLADSTVEDMVKYHKKDLGKIDFNDKEAVKNAVIDLIVDNSLQMKKTNNCIKGAPDRKVMPQTDEDETVFKNIKKTSKIKES